MLGGSIMKHSALVSLLLSLVVSANIYSQDGAAFQDIQFVQKLRAEGYKNLAEDYLRRLEKVGAPEIKAELPLELAITRLERATEEPDSAKRIAGYRKAAADFRSFMNANSGHVRFEEAKLYLARVNVLQGRNQLSRALANPASQRLVTPEMREARHTFEIAGAEIKQVVADLGRELAPFKNKPAATPADKAQKARLEQNDHRAIFEQGLNSYYQALTYPRTGDESIILDRGARLDEALRRFNTLSRLDDRDPLSWTARRLGGALQRRPRQTERGTGEV